MPFLSQALPSLGIMDPRTQLGRTGEDAAADLFRRLGFTVAERNFRCRHGELDLVVQRPGLVVFCEVKTRVTDRFGLPAEAVNHQKQQRLKRLAGIWLNHNPVGASQVRFDVVSVVARGTDLEITHFPDAF